MPSTGHEAPTTTTRPADADGPKRPVRVLIVDDHAVVIQALAFLLTRADGVEVAGQALDGRQAVEATATLRPDVVLMDIVMPGLTGIEAARQIRERCPESKVLMLTAYMEEEQVRAALRADVAGYVVKQANVEELATAIQAVARGETFFSPSIAQQAEVIGSTTSQRPAAAGADELLTGREREILQLVAEGHSNQWIARELVISVKTVETHRGNIRNKLGARSRADLIRYALRKGLVGLEPEPDVREQELPLAA